MSDNTNNDPNAWRPPPGVPQGLWDGVRALHGAMHAIEGEAMQAASIVQNTEEGEWTWCCLVAAVLQRHLGPAPLATPPRATGAAMPLNGQRFDLGQAVEIVQGGHSRTMLRPGFTLVGLTGRVVSSAANAPPGTTTVWVDWEKFGYDVAAQNLPTAVNVPTICLRPLGPEGSPARAGDKSARLASSSSSARPTLTVIPGGQRGAAPDDEDEGPRAA